ncbi:MAG: molybdate transporter permease subunit [Pseudomonadota bacterium]
MGQFDLRLRITGCGEKDQREATLRYIALREHFEPERIAIKVQRCLNVRHPDHRMKVFHARKYRMRGMSSSPEWLAIQTSIGVALRAVAFGLPIAVLLALVLMRSFRGRALLDAVVHAPLVLPPVVVGYALLLMFGVQGPFGRWLDRWFDVRLVFTTNGAALAAGIVALPVMVRSVRLALEAIDPQLDLAARSLGAGALDRLQSIHLPLALPGILSAAVLGFAMCLGEFGAVITFAANVPGETQTLALAIYGALQTPGGEPLALRLAGLSLAISIVALVLGEWLARQVNRKRRRA